MRKLVMLALIVVLVAGFGIGSNVVSAQGSSVYISTVTVTDQGNQYEVEFKYTYSGPGEIAWLGVWPETARGECVEAAYIGSFSDGNGCITSQISNQTLSQGYEYTATLYLPKDVFPYESYNWYPYLQVNSSNGLLGDFHAEGALMRVARTGYRLEVQVDWIYTGDVEEEISGSDEIFGQLATAWIQDYEDGAVDLSMWTTEMWEDVRTNTPMHTSVLVPEGKTAYVNLMLSDTEDWSEAVEWARNVNYFFAAVDYTKDVWVVYIPDPETAAAAYVAAELAAQISRYLPYAIEFGSMYDTDDVVFDGTIMLYPQDMANIASVGCMYYTAESSGSTGWFGYDNYSYEAQITICATRM